MSYFLRVFYQSPQLVLSNYLGLTDAAWEILDCLEAYLAKKLSGIVYAPDDGFYDKELQPIYKLETPVNVG